MPRTNAQNEWRKTHKRIEVRIELLDSDKKDWRAYADSQGLPLCTMIRKCIARCMELDGWTSQPEKTQDE